MSDGVAPQMYEPPWYERPELRSALAARDVGAVYRLLQQEGVPQREIARCTGQSQPEVSDIVRGRQVASNGATDPEMLSAAATWATRY